jgi:hypothetical protein
MSMFTRSLVAATIGAAIAGSPARAETPGVTSSEVKIGATFPFSGPASPLSATIKYVNAKKVPHLFVVSGVPKFTNIAEFPMTSTGLPSVGIVTVTITKDPNDRNTSLDLLSGEFSEPALDLIDP